MDPHTGQKTTKSAQPEGKGKRPRFQIVKLEERIAPGGGHGNGSNLSCGTLCNGTKGCGFTQ
jgi:hypothetical protein